MPKLDTEAYEQLHNDVTGLLESLKKALDAWAGLQGGEAIKPMAVAGRMALEKLAEMRRLVIPE